MIRPVLRLLRLEEADWLGRALRRDQDACRRFGALHPGDIWAEHALPALASDLAHGPDDDTPRTVGRAFDGLAPLDESGRHRSFPQSCTILARRDRAPTRTVCLLTTVRNEGPYILEWIAHHRLLGVEAFFIYSNDNDDGSDALLQALASAGVVTWLVNQSGSGVSPQFKAYAHALQIMADLLDFRWVGFIDLDEFVMLDEARYRGLPAFLDARGVDDVDGIMLNWVMFGSGGQSIRSDKPVTQRFRIREQAVNQHVKTFLRPHRFVHAMPHHPFQDLTVNPVFRAADGSVQPRSPFSAALDDRHAWIAHYYTKSAEEYVLRRSMHRADTTSGAEVSISVFQPAMASGFLSQHEQGGITDDRAAARSSALMDEIACLARLPGVAEAVRDIEHNLGSRLEKLARMAAGDPRFSMPGTPEHWFAQVLATAADMHSNRHKDSNGP